MAHLDDTLQLRELVRLDSAFRTRNGRQSWYAFAGSLFSVRGKASLALALTVQLACTREAGVEEGDYEAQVSTLLAGGVVESLDAAGRDCGQVQGGTRAIESYTFGVRRTGAAYAIAVGDGGCVLQGRQVGSVLVADGERCQFADDAPLVQLGVLRSTYSAFQLDTLAGTINTSGILFYNTNSGLLRVCGTTEGRIVGFNR